MYNSEMRPEAETLFGELADTHPNTALGSFCRFKQTLIRIQLGQNDVSEFLDELSESPLADFANVARMQHFLSHDRIADALNTAGKFLDESVHRRARVEAAMALWVDLRGRELELDARITPEHILQITRTALELSEPFDLLLPICIERGIGAALLELPIQVHLQAKLLSDLRLRLPEERYSSDIRRLMLAEAKLWAMRWHRDAALAVLDELDARPDRTDEQRHESALIRATARYRYGDLDEADRLFQAELEEPQALTPRQHFEALWGLARVRRRMPGKCPEAMELYEQALEVGENRDLADPEMAARARVEMGRTCIQMLDFDRAIEILQDVQFRFGSEGSLIARAVVPMAMALYYTECVDEAIDILYDFLDDFPCVPKWSDAASCLLGLYYLSRGEPERMKATVATLAESGDRASIQAGPQIVRDRHRLFARMLLEQATDDDVRAQFNREGVYNRAQIALFAADLAEIRSHPTDTVRSWLEMASADGVSESLHTSIARWKLENLSS